MICNSFENKQVAYIILLNLQSIEFLDGIGQKEITLAQMIRIGTLGSLILQDSTITSEKRLL